MTLVDITVSLRYDGGGGLAWHDISPDVLTRDGGIRITRGRRDAGSAADPGTMTLKLRGRESKVAPGVVGRYSPKNPRSDLYGLIGEFTPIRVQVPSARAGLWLPNIRDGQHERRDVGLEVTRAFAMAPQPPAAPTAAIDARIDVTPESWNPPFADVLWGQWASTGGFGWMISLQGGASTGFLAFRWFDGAVTQIAASAFLPAGLAARRTVRVTMVGDTGSGREIRFWLGDWVSGPFTQHGTTQTGTATVINASTSAIEIGSAARGRGAVAGTNPLRGTVHAAQLRSSVDGPILVNPDFEAQEPVAASGAADSEVIPSFTDSTGELWQLRHFARITNPGIRAEMEMVKWPQRSDRGDVWVPAEAVGVMHRLSGREVRQSTLRRHTMGDAGVVAYWPCEDGPDATELAPATPDTETQKLRGEISVAAFDGLAGSAPIPTLRDGGSTEQGRWIRPHTNGMDQYRGVFAIPTEGLTNSALLVWLGSVGSSFERAQVVYGTGGSLRLELRDDDGVLVDTTGAIGFAVDGTKFLLAVVLDQDGADLDWSIWVVKQSLADNRSAASSSAVSGTFTGQTFGRFIRVRVGIFGNSGGLSFGHQTVIDSTSPFPLTQTLRNALLAFTQEPAGDRFLRLPRERGVDAYLAGEPGSVGFDAPVAGVDGALTEPMGPQPSGRLLNLLQECAEADHGIMHEGRDLRALAMLPRQALYRIDPAVTLDYSAHHPSPPLHPTDDNRFLTNDVTVQQPEGSSARVFVATGPLSILEPPDGIGAGHATTPPLNVAAARLPDHANKLLVEGVSRESRYTAVRVDLRRIGHNLGLPDLREALLQLETGWRLDLTGLPEWLDAQPARTIVQGYGEQIEREGHTITFGTHPYGPAGQVSWWTPDGYTPGPDEPVRYSPFDARTATSFVVGTDTALAVEDQTGGNDLPGSPDLPLDLLVRGVRLRATAFGAPTGGAYTITVEQASLNGLDGITIAAGERVELYTPATYAL